MHSVQSIVRGWKAIAIFEPFLTDTIYNAGDALALSALCLPLLSEAGEHAKATV